jgi:hypothetical protein
LSRPDKRAPAPSRRPCAQPLARYLCDLVFHDIFPHLARAIAAAALAAPLPDVRDAALVLLYRLLFILYAEDRNLLPAGDPRYDAVGLRRIRDDIAARTDLGEAFSATAARYWTAFDGLCRAMDAGDPAIGLPPYDGGLFDARRAPLLTKVRLGDAVMAEVIGALSFERTPEGRRYIDYRDLGVRQLGAIYERLLKLELVRDGAEVLPRPDIFARRTSGSYYTPDDLVALVIRETLGPLVAERMEAFRAKAEELAGYSKTCPQGRPQTPSSPEEDVSEFDLSAWDSLSPHRGERDGVRRAHHVIGALQRLDPAERLLELKICDPAMGAGHFLVSLVDYLADQVIAAMTETEAETARRVPCAKYVSPLRDRIALIRGAILRQAKERGWPIDPARLDDRHIVRRMVAARCIYGVDKNPMAVELARTALQLHTLTPGAPPVFLDHHLRCGDSLFGLSVRKGMDKAAELGAPSLLQGPVTRAMGAAGLMQAIDELSDAGIAEACRPADAFAKVREMTTPLDALLSLLHAFDWLGLGKDEKRALRAFVQGQFGDPVQLALGTAKVTNSSAESAGLSRRAKELIAEERFFNWQAAFPSVWAGSETDTPSGGFDAIIGNPPWDRMKLQQVEWFAARRCDIATAARAADRAGMIAALETSGDPLAQDYAKASARADAAARMARASGDYPLLSGGDINLYSLFVERAMALVRPGGVVGLLTPSGIASDKTAARFFKGVATHGRLRALYDFENRRTRFGEEPFFPDVDSRFKFCVFVASPTPLTTPARCAFFLQDVSELADAQKCFSLTAQDFARVNPNTGTAPVFRSRRDADLTIGIYDRLPVLVDRSTRRSLPPPPLAGDERNTVEDERDTAEVETWPVRYMTMFHMTNDSLLFRTKTELVEKEKAHPIGGNRWQSRKGMWLPLYEGKMAQAFDHRAASVVVNAQNRHRPAQPEPANTAQRQDPAWLPEPQYWVEASDCGWSPDETWVLGFKEITSPTNERTFVSALFPTEAFGNKIPLLRARDASRCAHLLCANLNSIVFDFVVRQKIQGQTLNRFIVEQLPVAPPDHYGRRFGPVTAARIVRDAVLELTYTSHDMASFAADMGFTGRTGGVRPPFAWDDARRAMLRAKLDAIYFHLYGVTDRNDIRYIYSTFPILEQKEIARHGRYLSRDLCLAWMDKLDAGEPEADIFCAADL